MSGAFVARVKELMDDPRKHFKVMQKGLQTYCISQVSGYLYMCVTALNAYLGSQCLTIMQVAPQLSFQFLVSCLYSLLKSSDEMQGSRNAAASHLMLELFGTVTLKWLAS